jgi:hypothetical protein
MNTCGYSLYVTSYLTRESVCRLQMLLVLASAVILRSESRGTHDHISLSQIRDSANLEARSPYLYPPGTGWPGYTPRHCVPSYISQGYGGGTRPRLHEGLILFAFASSACVLAILPLGTDRVESTVSNSSCITHRITGIFGRRFGNWISFRPQVKGGRRHLLSWAP